MERLVKELLLERQKLEQLKADVNEMEYDALQRRFRRVNSSSFIPRVSSGTSPLPHFTLFWGAISLLIALGWPFVRTWLRT